MKRILIGVSALLLFVITTTVFSKPQRHAFTGNCVPEGSWVVVITVDTESGLVTDISGSDCNGNHWRGHCGIMPAVGGNTYHKDLENGACYEDIITETGSLMNLHGQDASGNNWAMVEQGNVILK